MDKITNKFKDNSTNQSIENKMRVLANFLIDCFIEEKNNNQLHTKIKSSNINLDEYENHGTI